MFTITKTPILILSSPRTGSTVLGSYIQKLCTVDTHYFNEPDYNGVQGMEEFYHYFSQSKDFILKCQYVHLQRYRNDISDYLLSNAYKIRIRRRNFIDQVASIYIATARGKKWHFKKKDELTLADSIPIDLEIIKKHMSYIKYANYELNSTPINFDLDLFYEDLPKMTDVDYYIVPKPSNNDELLDTITKLISH
jgi:hypothetical protein